MFDPTYMTESKVTLGEGAGLDYGAEVSGFQLVPTYQTATWKGLKPGSVYTKSGKATWVLTINFGQDHEAATSLSTFLFEHEGETMPYDVEPIDGGTAFSGTLIAQAGPIGGEVDQFGNATVNLPVNGKPTRTPAA
ncbi:hypothetical protein [Microbacterium kyungheense]|uniref:Uncharacterized protein n=2 Tax=Microbacterium kyungheense TaxID=1263636 RepID=A0A543EU80_9MICO|nr:hypothetical protein [Microbacterium kyungheense]TQM25114.1 hypothetical protein FB391_2573 [Microbacterium kyungheense]